ncbi:MAG: hypothetical protein SF097_00020 [Acidobacteriota bacterium]|nr:hypothetical protein [Acidobacteriota bacterium]
MFNRRLIAIAVFVFAVFFLSTRTGSTHEPITTKVMFNKEVVRILQRNCLGCHAPNKIKADISLTTYEEARPWAKAIKEEVLEKRMMPFQAVKGYGRFQHDYLLTQRDTELLVSWIEGGAPRGDIKDYPKHEIEHLIHGKDWSLGEPDLVLQSEEVKLTAKSKAETRCFVLPTNLKAARSLSAIDFQPGNGTVVHSASFHLRSTKPIPPNVKMSTCGMIGETLGVWVPGQTAIRLPAGVGRKLNAGGEIFLQVRYRNSGEAATDRSRVALYFAKEAAPKALRTEAVNPAAVTVPANAEHHLVKASMTVAQSSEVVSIRPLLFPFAKSVEAKAIRPDGSIEVLIVARDYRYDWQPAYFFKTPVSLPRGTRIEVTAYLDNSDNNRNQPNDPPVELKLNSPLCEIALAQPPQLKPASPPKSGVYKGGLQ